MKFLLSWIKEYIKFNFKKKYIYKIFNNIGIEIIYIKKIFPIKYKYQKNIILGKILFINKINNIFKYKIISYNNIIYYCYYKKFIKKFTKILIENINNKYYIVCINNNYDYIIKTFIPHNISYLSNYLNLTNEILSYLKYKNIKYKYNYKIFKKKKLNFKKLHKNIININIKKKYLIYYNSFLIKNINYTYSNFRIQKKLILLNSLSINNIVDIKNIIFYETGLYIEILKINNIKNNNFYIKQNNKNFKFLTDFNKIINIKKKYNDIFIYNNKIPISLLGIINNNNKCNILYKNYKNIKYLLLSFSIYNIKKIRYTFNKYNIKNNITKLFNNKIKILNNNYIYNNILIKYSNILFKKNIYIKNILFYNKYNKFNIIKIKIKNIYNIIGIKISLKIILKILFSLNYNIKYYNKKKIFIKINNKKNINSKINIINDIIRFYNINNIKNKNNNIKIITNYNNNYKKFNIIYKIENIIIDILINNGFFEIINTPFINNKNKINKNIKLIYIKNYKKYLRNTLFIKMINNIIYNINRKINYKIIKIFELSNIYYIKNKKIINKKNIEILLISNNYKKKLFYIYKIINIIFTKLGIYNYKKKIIYNNKLFNIKINLIYKNYIFCTLGILNNLFNIKNKFIILTILNIKNIYKIIYKNKINTYNKINKIQFFEKHLTFIINKNIFFSDIYKLSKKILNNKLIKLYLYDIYNKNINKNKKSYTLHFIIKNKYGYKKKYINNILNKIINIFNLKLNAKLKK
ncbi:MAG: hypothetical protein RDO_0710 [Flavobacteriales endosymbiont of Rhyzopertha dominica]|nr:MAG: phenylalanine--tRNA ligase beta subunit-related protein [Candidatus Shikimatogenerans bostrichidophilus]